MNQKKWKSPVVWTSFVALVLTFLTDVLDIQVDHAMINTIINGAIAVLIGFGILNNPNDSQSF